MFPYLISSDQLILGRHALDVTWWNYCETRATDVTLQVNISSLSKVLIEFQTSVVEQR